MIKNLPAIQETQVQFLGWEDPLEKGKAVHSSVLAWRIPWTEEPGGLQWCLWKFACFMKMHFAFVLKITFLIPGQGTKISQAMWPK